MWHLWTVSSDIIDSRSGISPKYYPNPNILSFSYTAFLFALHVVSISWLLMKFRAIQAKVQSHDYAKDALSPIPSRLLYSKGACLRYRRLSCCGLCPYIVGMNTFGE